MSKCWLFLGLWLWASCAYGACANTLTPSMAQKVSSNDLSLLVLEDPENNLAIDDVTSLPVSSFISSTGTLSSSMRNGSVWIRLCLIRDSDAPSEWMLVLLPAYLKSIDFYSPQYGYKEARSQGFSLPYQNRENDYRGFSFELDVSDQHRSIYYFKISFYNRSSADVLLLTPKKFTRFIALDYLGYGFYLGMAILVVCINLIFWYRLRDPVYWRYALMMVLLSGFSSITGGYFSQFISVSSAISLPTLMMLNSTLVGAAFCLFIQSAFKLFSHYRYFYYLSWLFAVGFLTLGGLFLLGDWDWLYRLNSVFTAVLVFIFLGVSLHSLRRHRSLRLYAVAFLPLQAALVLSVLKSIGLGSWIPLVDYLPNVASLVHMVLLNVALARRAWQAEQDKRAARDDLLIQANKHNQELEVKVADRTRSLNQANHRLKSEVDERSRMEIKLRESLQTEQLALQAQKQFVAMVSHEFRSPLAVIDVAAQNLDAELSEQHPNVARRVQRIRRNTTRLTGLINNCLTSDRLSSANSGDLKIHTVNVTALLKNLFPSCYGQGRVDLRLHGDDIFCGLDPDLVSIAMVNVVDNALKYSPDDSPVEVTLTLNANRVEVTVCDLGSGIPESSRDRIFEKYYRAPAAQNMPGSGLGLYLSRLIMEQHGGTLELAPQTKVKSGSCFILRWPHTGSPA